MFLISCHQIICGIITFLEFCKVCRRTGSGDRLELTGSATVGYFQTSTVRCMTDTNSKIISHLIPTQPQRLPNTDNEKTGLQNARETRPGLALMSLFLSPPPDHELHYPVLVWIVSVPNAIRS